jgi:CHAT domain-containing protein/tetratricopeptide (TPR) repeat protein
MEIKNLLRVIDRLLQAEKALAKKRIVEQHPELLSEAAHNLLNQLISLARSEGDEDAAKGFEFTRDLLVQCRVEGIDAAFARVIQPWQPVMKTDLTLDGPDTPAEFEADNKELLKLHKVEWGDPEVRRQRINLMERMLSHPNIDKYPGFRANLLITLGGTYSLLATNDRYANVQKAIACYSEAQSISTSEITPFKHATIQMNLGLAYYYMPWSDSNERTDILQRAIACYQKALEYFTPEAASLGYATTQTYLGLAHADLPTGNPGTNLQRAIDCYHEALLYRTAEATPLDYASTQNNLGIAYAVLPIGDRFSNLQKAIACYREALRFRSPTMDPFDYASTQANLGRAYDFLSELDPLERSSNVQMAIAFYKEALRFYTLEGDPAYHLMTTTNLGNLCFADDRWNEAHAAYTDAIEATEMFYEAAATDKAREAELHHTSMVLHNDAYSLAGMGRYNEAAERLESGKSRALAAALLLDQAELKQASPNNRKRFQATLSRVKKLESESRAIRSIVYNPSEVKLFVTLSAELNEARKELRGIVNEIRRDHKEFIPSKLNLESIVTATATDCPLVYLVTTSKGTLALVVPTGVERLEEEHVGWLDDFTIDDLDDLFISRDAEGKVTGGYLIGQMIDNVKLLETSLEDALPNLGEQLMGLLATRLTHLGFHQVTLVPCGRLALLPLHAALYDSSAGGYRYFLDDFEVTYSPSARALIASRRAADVASYVTPSLFAVVDPPHADTPHLQFGRIELENILPSFPAATSHLLYESEATQTATLQAAPGHTYLHFSCHGRFDPLLPLQSALLLAGEDLLTLKDILDKAKFDGIRLAVLSACQTAITDYRRIPDEAVGFPAGFLQAGVPGVVSALWPVADISTALLISQFYRYHLQDGLNPAAALRQAQLWLKDLSAGELTEHFAERRLRSGRYRRQVSGAWRRFAAMAPTEKPFAHPYYWASFTLTGA